MKLAAAFLLAALEASAEESPKFAFSAGTGIAYGVAGAHGELIIEGHVAPYLTAGVNPFSTWGAGLCFGGGLRIFFRDGAGPLLSLGVASSSSGSPQASNRSFEHDSVSELILGAAVGWRLRWASGFFAEAAAGAARVRSNYEGYTYAPGAYNVCGASTQSYSCSQDHFVPDVTIAVGFAH